MAKLSKKEQDLLDRLNAKLEAPESSPANRSISVNIDLGDEKQVKLAQRFGFLDRDDDEDDDDGSDDDDKEADQPPKRRGYFE